MEFKQRKSRLWKLGYYREFNFHPAGQKVLSVGKLFSTFKFEIPADGAMDYLGF